MDMIPVEYPDRNLTEPRRIAYRAGWTLYKLGAPLSLAERDAWKQIVASYPAADRGECAMEFETAWVRRQVTLLAVTVED